MGLPALAALACALALAACARSQLMLQTGWAQHSVCGDDADGLVVVRAREGTVVLGDVPVLFADMDGPYDGECSLSIYAGVASVFRVTVHMLQVPPSGVLDVLVGADEQPLRVRRLRVSRCACLWPDGPTMPLSSRCAWEDRLAVFAVVLLEIRALRMFSARVSLSLLAMWPCMVVRVGWRSVPE